MAYLKRSGAGLKVLNLEIEQQSHAALKAIAAAYGMTMGALLDELIRKAQRKHEMRADGLKPAPFKAMRLEAATP
jgi:predicted DNA-binding ribbon-helix-helix protein